MMNLLIVNQEIKDTRCFDADFYRLRNLLYKKDWDGLEAFFCVTWFPGRQMNDRQLHYESEAAVYEIYRFLEENGINMVEFWTGILAEKSKNRHDSLEGFSDWILAAVDSLRNICEGGTDEKEMIASIKLFIDRNIELKITRDQIAAHVYFSIDYTGRIFKKETGYSLNKYIMEQKMDYARKWIEEGGKPIGDIAGRLGYSSSSHFTEIFRRLTGYTPSEYRRKVRNTDVFR